MFDLSKRNVFSYSGHYRTDRVVLTNNEIELYKNYECYKHSYISRRCLINKKIKLKLPNFEIITVNLNRIVDAKDLYYPQIKLYYRIGNFKAGPVVICFVFDCVMPSDIKSKEVWERCYAFRDIIDNSRNENREVELFDLDTIQKRNMTRYYMDKLYREAVTTVDIFIHNTFAIYRGGFTIDSNGDNYYSYVAVEGPLRAGGIYKFVKFVHTPTVDYFISMNIRCHNDCCRLSEYCDHYFNSTNVKKVIVYFKQEDSKRNFPLAIRIVEKEGDGTFFKLYSIEDRPNTDPSHWFKTYVRDPLLLDKNEDNLDEIYTAHKDKIEAVIPKRDPYKKIFNGVLYGTIASSLVLLGVSLGLYIKMNYARLVSAAATAYSRLR